MNVIFKYPFTISDRVEMVLPSEAEILCVNEQSGKIFLWAKVETTSENEERFFRVFGTGHEIEKAFYGYYITTVFCSNRLVWHVYEEERLDYAINPDHL